MKKAWVWVGMGVLIGGVAIAQAADPGTPFMGQARQVTFDGARSGEGYFSADGKRMVFQSERESGNPFYQIYTIDLITGATERVTPGVGKATCGWILPDSRVLFASTQEDPQAHAKQVAELERRASGQKQSYAWDFDENYDLFLASKNLKGQWDYSVLAPARGYDAEGAVSPDGQWVVFTSNRRAYERELSEEERALFAQDPSYFADLYLVKTDGTGLRQLTAEPGYDGGAFFSPDGKEVVYRHFDSSGRRAEVFTLSVDAGAQRHQVTHAGRMAWAPFYHPSGDYLIYTVNVDDRGNFELYIVDRQGLAEPVRLTDDAGFDGLPVFTPDGRHLAWSSSRDQTAGAGGRPGAQIFVANWDDARARESLQLPPATQTDFRGSRAVSPFSEVSPGAKQLDQFFLRTVEELASPRYEGRLTGSLGIRRAREWLRSSLEQMGLHTRLEAFEYRLTPQGSAFTDDNLIATFESNTGVPSARPKIIIGAHLDHLGRGEIPHASLAQSGQAHAIHPGADDNASGVAGVLLIAQALARAGLQSEDALPFDVVFALWSGEELGTLGSAAFLKQHPDWQIAAYLNMDMIGNWAWNPQNPSSPTSLPAHSQALVLQGAGSAQQWRGWIERVLVQNGFPPVRVTEDPYLPTDAMPFYVAGVPVLSAFSGAHAAYHTPQDTADRVAEHVAGGRTAAQIVADLFWAIERAGRAPTYLKVAAPQPAAGHSARVSLGTIPDYAAATGEGVRLMGVRAGSPAERAGLRGGDTVVRLGELDVRGIEDYTRALGALKADVEAVIEIRRGNERLVLRVIPVSQ